MWLLSDVVFGVLFVSFVLVLRFFVGGGICVVVKKMVF